MASLGWHGETEAEAEQGEESKNIKNGPDREPAQRANPLYARERTWQLPSSNRWQIIKSSGTLF
jgi:hypothetical protein